MNLAPRPVGTARLALEYVLPLRWDDGGDLAELTDYLTALATWVDVTVVDGSPPEVFATHAARWDETVRHVRPAVPARNGKVAGALTGVHLARHADIVIADDDVRCSQSLGAVARRARDGTSQSRRGDEKDRDDLPRRARARARRRRDPGGRRARRAGARDGRAVPVRRLDDRPVLRRHAQGDPVHHGRGRPVMS